MPTPSLLMIPSAFKSGVLASVLPSDGAGDFTVSRPSIATRVNSDGIIETMAADVPRLDYSDGGCPVLLTEPQSTNDYLNSQAMVTQTTTTVADTYTVSFEGTGTIALSGTFTGSLVGTGVNDLVQLTFTSTAGALLSTVTGTVNEAQLEKLPYATSRIRTIGTTVTRLADRIDGAGDVNTFNSEEGVFVINIGKNDESDIKERDFSLSDGSVNNRVFIRYTQASRVTMYIIVDGITALSKSFIDVVNITDIHEYVFVWGLNKLALYIDGLEITPTTNTGVTFPPNTLSEINFDRSDGNSPMYCKTKKLRVYKSIAEAQVDLPYIV